MAEQVRRVITVFRRGCDNREFQTDVTVIPFELVRKVVPPGPDDPLLYDCYELNPDQLTALAAYLGEVFEPDRYDYFLEAETA
jgi:hypothetical protein